MNAYLVLIVSSLAQFTAHFSDVWLDRMLGNGWRQLFAYMIGVGVNAPFLDMLMAEFGIEPKRRRLIMLLYFASFFFGGLGCLFGWLARPTPDNNKERGNEHA